MTNPIQGRLSEWQGDLVSKNSPQQSISKARQHRKRSLAENLPGLDWATGLVSIMLLAILLVIGIGDRIGVQVISVSPMEDFHSTSPLLIQFSEAMNEDSLVEHFSVEPAIAGNFSWNDSTLRFQPQSAFQPSETYTFTLRAGALGESGRELLDTYQFSITISYPRIAYMYPAGAYLQNIWILVPRNAAGRQQLTNSSLGIYDFVASPDGTKIAFAEFGPIARTASIQILDLESGSSKDLSHCIEVQSACVHPGWRPDGQMLAYERMEDNSELGMSEASPKRTWLLNMTTNPPSTRPLFEDSQIVNYNPQWSADGNLLAVYSLFRWKFLFTISATRVFWLFLPKAVPNFLFHPMELRLFSLTG
jgi:hypothetical protein